MQVVGILGEWSVTSCLYFCEYPPIGARWLHMLLWVFSHNNNAVSLTASCSRSAQGERQTCSAFLHAWITIFKTQTDWIKNHWWKSFPESNYPFVARKKQTKSAITASVSLQEQRLLCPWVLKSGFSLIKDSAERCLRQKSLQTDSMTNFEI